MPFTCRRAAHALARTNLGASVLALSSMAVLYLWLPVSLSAVSPSLRMNLLERIEPRALVGTLVHALSAHPPAQARWLTAINMLALFGWLMCVLKIVERGNGSGDATSKFVAIRVFWVVLFAFSVNPYNAFVALFVDMPAAALVAVTALICLSSQPRASRWRIGLITMLALAATLVHEKSIFDLLILFLWLSGRCGLGAAARLLAPGLSLAVTFVLLVSNRASWGLPAKDYAGYVLSLHNPIIAESFNVWGIVFGGGAFWLIYLLLGASWRRNAVTRREKIQRTTLVCGMALVCVAQLLIAHDTNRLMALIWLPVALVAGVMPIERMLSSVHLAWVCLVLIAFQLAMPPSLVFQNGMVPYNCYANAIADRLPKASQTGQAGNLSLAAYDQNPLTVYLVKMCR
jgi:hypothetical protein